jgi:beta-lactamase superfamily II metal-dependent hydrolase
LKKMDPDGIWSSLILDIHHRRGPEDLYRILGFVHLYSLSGLHFIAIFQVVEFFLSKLLEGLNGRNGVFVSKQREVLGVTFLTRGLGILLGGWLCLLTAGRTGLFRPIAVMALRSVFRNWGLRFGIWFPLGISCSLHTLIWLGNWFKGEASSFWQGQWHYALAVAGGVWGLDRVRSMPRLRYPRVLCEHLAMAFGSWAFTAVWTLLVEHQVALATPFLSLITIPIIAFVGVPQIVLLSLSEDILDQGRLPKALRISFQAMNDLFSFLFQASVDHSTLFVVQPFDFWLGLAGVALGFALWNRGLRRERFRVLPRWVFLIGLSFVGIRIVEVATHSKVSQHVEASRLLQVNVGQGDAAWILRESWGSRTHLEWIDFGPPFVKRDRDWISLASRLGVSQIDSELLTHTDLDHRGGLSQISGLFHRECPWESGRDCLKSFHTFRSRGGGPNESMWGVRVFLENGSEYWNLGDAEEGLEWDLLQGLSQVSDPRSADLRRSRTLKLSHHGSKTSSSDRVLSQIRPTEAWVSASYLSPFGHPHQEVLARLKSLSVPVLSTWQTRDGLWIE